MKQGCRWSCVCMIDPPIWFQGSFKYLGQSNGYSVAMGTADVFIMFAEITCFFFFVYNKTGTEQYAGMACVVS